MKVYDIFGAANQVIKIGDVLWVKSRDKVIPYISAEKSKSNSQSVKAWSLRGIGNNLLSELPSSSKKTLKKSEIVDIQSFGKISDKVIHDSKKISSITAAIKKLADTKGYFLAPYLTKKDTIAWLILDAEDAAQLPDDSNDVPDDANDEVDDLKPRYKEEINLEEVKPFYQEEKYNNIKSMVTDSLIRLIAGNIHITLTATKLKINDIPYSNKMPKDVRDIITSSGPEFFFDISTRNVSSYRNSVVFSAQGNDAWSVCELKISKTPSGFEIELIATAAIDTLGYRFGSDESNYESIGGYVGIATSSDKNLSDDIFTKLRDWKYIK